ncbi:hypothetical protein F4823DRAFT_584275 [Ustulina deusta]|nr:hypothetical protein F4823DRAFT_584275 [Ustulina deusta]
MVEEPPFWQLFIIICSSFGDLAHLVVAPKELYRRFPRRIHGRLGYPGCSSEQQELDDSHKSQDWRRLRTVHNSD